MATDSIVTSYGTELATTTESASTLPLPTSLAGTTVRLIDEIGVVAYAQIFFVSPNQVNYLMPNGLTGRTDVTISSGDGKITTGLVVIDRVAPALFTSNGDGKGVPSGYLFRYPHTSSILEQAYEPIAQYDSEKKMFVPSAIDLGPESEHVYLVLYGTGMRRYYGSPVTVSAKVNGVEIHISELGPAQGYAGLDQINLLLPKSLAGSGLVPVEIIVNGKTANIVYINIR